MGKMCDSNPANSIDYCGLFARWRAGDAAVEGQLYALLKALAKPVVRCAGIDNNEVDDVAGDAVTRVMSPLDSSDVASSWDEERCVKPWFMAIARNLAFDVIRKATQLVRKHAELRSHREIRPQQEAICVSEERIEENQQIQAAIDSLPFLHAEALKLTMRDITDEQIARILKCRVETMRTRRFRAVEALRERLRHDSDFRRAVDAIRKEKG